VPRTLPIATGEGLSANTSSGITPVPLLAHSSTRVDAYSTEAATLNLYVLKQLPGCEWPPFGEPDADGNPQWQKYDSVSISADTLESYLFSNPTGLVGAEIVMGGTAGNYDLHINYRP